MKRFAIFIISVLSLAIFALGCASAATNAAVPAATAAQSASTASATDSAMLELTLDQLKAYDGKNGNPAYVAVDGVIYDVSNVPQWKNGEHNGYSAGNDLTDIIKNKSPHGVKQLNGVPVVGKIVEG